MKWHPSCMTSSTAWYPPLHGVSNGAVLWHRGFPEMLSIRAPQRGHLHQHHGSQGCSPSAHHDMATTTDVAAPGDVLHQGTTMWPPSPASWLPEMLSISPPRCGHHHRCCSSRRCSPSPHHAMATTSPWGQGILLTSWARHWICHAPDGHLGGRSRSQAAASSTSWLHTGLAFMQCPTSSVPSMGSLWVSPSP